MQRWGLFALTTLTLWACADAGPKDGAPGPRVAIDVAALSLAGVGDVVWDLEVLNGATPAQVVWQRRITSSTFGDGVGSASYVGPCDAGAAQNTVRVWVVGLYRGDIDAGDAGAFNAGSTAGDGAVTGTALEFENPTTAAPLTRVVTCSENQDAAVAFEVTLMRPASQGFFDVAVSFNNIFCSAKLDCCDVSPGEACAGDGSDDIDLLFDAAGARNRTVVLGFACTAGLASDVSTELYLDDLVLDCDVGSDVATFAADVTVNPDPATSGNLCTPGADAMDTCAAVDDLGAADADDYLFQAAVFRGEEQLNVGGGSAHKAYWNVALGVKGRISECTLRTRATADDAASDTDGVVDGNITAGVVYPYVTWDVDLGSCGAEPLSFSDPNAPVTTAYTETTATEDEAFAYVFGPGLPATPDPPTPPESCGGGDCSVFSHTGTDQTFTVPAGVTSVAVKLWAGGGGGGGECLAGACTPTSVGGAGGYASATFSVTPGESLTVVVAGGGRYIQNSGNAWGGGGAVGVYGGEFTGGGGGRTAIRRGSTELVTAGGGGGGGGENDTHNGGPGGGAVGVAAPFDCGGGGGTQTGGGAYGGCNHGDGSPGGPLQGGDNSYCGGGGGGGWYGGGSGNHRSPATYCGGGGGGSGHLDASVTGTLTAGSGATPPETGDSDYAAGIGVGGPNQADGGHGRVVILY